MPFLVRVRTRDGTERLQVPDNCTLADMRKSIEEKYQVPQNDQTLSLQQGLLMSKNPAAFNDLTENSKPLRALGINNGDIVYLAYSVEREPTPTMQASFRSELQGGKMTVESMIAKQTRIERQETSHCTSVSFDGSAANAFQAYINGTLGFAQMRFGWMYGTCNNEGEVKVEFIYEPEQEGAEDTVSIKEGTDECSRADKIASALGYKKVGCIFNISSKERDYNLSAWEVKLIAKHHAAHPDKFFVSAVVMQFEDEDDGKQVSIEPFQLSDQCVKLYSEGFFSDEEQDPEKPNMTKLTKDVIVVDKVSKDVTEVDTDFWLIPVKILDHEGDMDSRFPVENRLHPVQTVEDLKDSIQKSNKSYAQRLKDFHLLLFLSKHLDINSDMALILNTIKENGTIAEGYKLIIDNIAGIE